MIRKSNKYSRPKKPFEYSRIQDENALRKRYGLKNKKEIWKTLAKINYFRRRAKELAKSPREEQEAFFRKLKALGLNTNSIADVLDLKVTDLLERRLPTVVVKRKLASTPNQARQFVVHKKVLVSNKLINVPSYIVRVDEEKSISIKQKRKSSPKLQAETQAPQTGETS